MDISPGTVNEHLELKDSMDILHCCWSMDTLSGPKSTTLTTAVNGYLVSAAGNEHLGRFGVRPVW
jgi:hypothetical protein